MSKHERSSANLRFVALWLVAGVFEAPTLITMAGWSTPITAGWGAAGHVFAALLVFFAPPKERGWFKPTRHWGQPLGLLTLVLPALGWVITGMVVLSHGKAPFDKDAYRFEDDSHEDANPLAGMGSDTAIRKELADALDVLPAVDALLSHAPALKRGAIETLARIRSPEAVSWILRARQDRDSEVRFFATTALTRLKRDFEMAIHAAEAEVFRRPADLPAQLALHRIRYEYAASGMLESTAKAAILEDCRARLTSATSRSPESTRLLYLVERQLNPERALRHLEQLEAAEPERRARWTRDRADLLFSLGRFKEVRTLLRARREELAKDLEGSIGAHEWRSTLLWWADA